MRSTFFSFFGKILCAAVVIVVALTVSTRAHAQTDGEKKAQARTLFVDAAKLQEAGNYPDALKKFEAAQKLYSAPTQMLHIAECQAMLGRLVDSSESYQSLARMNVGENPPQAFVSAQQQGAAELPGVRARIPTLKIDTTPSPDKLQNLQITLNDKAFTVELVGSAVPLDPGTYRVNATATGYSLAQPVDVILKEKENRNVALNLTPAAGGPAIIVVPAPGPGTTNPPPPPGPGTQPPPPYDSNNPSGQKKDEKHVSSLGLMLGLRAGVVFPGGSVATSPDGVSSTSISNLAGTGGELGFDVGLRFAKSVYIGGVFDFGSLGANTNAANGGGIQSLLSPQGVSAQNGTSVSESLIGIDLGFMSSADKTAFWGEGGVGYRKLNFNFDFPGGSQSVSYGGPNFWVGIGAEIPAGHFRFVPKGVLYFGTFGGPDLSNATTTANFASSFQSSSSATSFTTPTGNVFLWLGLAAYYDIFLN